MLTVETWAEIRRLHVVEKLSKRAIAKRLAIHRSTVTRALASQLPPRYTRPPRPSSLDPFKPKTHALLELYPALSGVRVQELLKTDVSAITAPRDAYGHLNGHRRETSSM